VSLGLWHNFGHGVALDDVRAMLRTAFDLGITHFDLANNYGPPPGSAEEHFGRPGARLRALPRRARDLAPRPATCMWPGPYGEWGSRKYLLSSLDQSLERMGLDYVDIFYSHRFDPETPLEETMGALATARCSRARPSTSASRPTRPPRRARRRDPARHGRAAAHPPALYSILNRWIEPDLLDTSRTRRRLHRLLAAGPGLLTDKYLDGARARKASTFRPEFLRPDVLDRVRALNEIARGRGQSLAQMALAWCLRDPRVTSVLIGASRPEQIVENVAALGRLEFGADELAAIDRQAADAGLNIWARSHTAG
jgi:L-glyceraldehyde 3-phosphate reductase